MVNTLDFDDINNYMYLSNESNLWLAKHYAHTSILREAEAVPKFKNHPATSGIVWSCIEMTYNPLAGIELFENFLCETLPQLSSIMLDSNKPDLKTMETLIYEAEGYARNKNYAPYKDGDMGELMFWLGKLSLLSKNIFDLGANVRKSYSELVRGAEIVAQEFCKSPFDVWEETYCTDEVMRIVFPTAGSAKSFFTQYRIPELRLQSIVMDLNDKIRIHHDLLGFSEFTSLIPSTQELKEANDLNEQYSTKEIKRIYSSQTQ